MSDVVLEYKSRGDSTWMLEKHLVGTPQEYHYLIKIEKNGKCTRNEFGGYNNCRVGQPRYIKQFWNKL